MGTSPTTLHNIKRLKIFGGSLVCKREGHKPELGISDSDPSFCSAALKVILI